MCGLAACGTTYDVAHDDFIEDFYNGEYAIAGDIMAVATVSANPVDTPYIGGLQCGTAYLWSGDAAERKMCFDTANNVLNGTLDDDSGYRIKQYEKIAMATYQGIGEILDASNDAGMFFNRAYMYQSENVQDNDAEITAAQEKINKNMAGVNTNLAISQAISEMDSAPDAVAPMRDYVNPYTTYIGAIYNALNGDMGNAPLDFSRVKAFAPNNHFVVSDLDTIKSHKDSVWVFFENGMVGDIRPRALAPAVLQVFGIRISVPDIFPGTPALSNLRVTADGKSVNTEFLANMDSIVKTDINKYRNANIIKSIAFESGKVAAAIMTKSVTNKMSHKNNNNLWLDFLGTYAMIGIMSSDQPWDLRSWTALPHEIQVARVDMPRTRTLVLDDKYTVEIPNEIKNAAVFIRLPSAGATPSIGVGRLN
ncbi:MAG: hypothetical protein J6T57_02185 [Alphaproteobacteria bacterium]|nr:hypothetical protein [Alphaproteobacteria bacterium]